MLLFNRAVRHQLQSLMRSHQLMDKETQLVQMVQERTAFRHIEIKTVRVALKYKPSFAMLAQPH